MGVVSGVKAINKAALGVTGAVVKASWKPVAWTLKAPLKAGQWAVNHPNNWVKYPSIATAGLAAAGTGALIINRAGRNSSELPPEMLETQAMLNENQQMLDGVIQQEAMMQQMPPQVMAQQAANQPDFQVSQMEPQGQLAQYEQTLGQG